MLSLSLKCNVVQKITKNKITLFTNTFWALYRNFGQFQFYHWFIFGWFYSNEIQVLTFLNQRKEKIAIRHSVEIVSELNFTQETSLVHIDRLISIIEYNNERIKKYSFSLNKMCFDCPLTYSDKWQFHLNETAVLYSFPLCFPMGKMCDFQSQHSTRFVSTSCETLWLSCTCAVNTFRMHTIAESMQSSRATHAPCHVPYAYRVLIGWHAIAYRFHSFAFHIYE